MTRDVEADEATLTADLVPPLEARLSEAPPSTLDRYELLFELARGGLGVVYVGRLRGAHGFDRLVAIKRMRTSTGAELRSFLDEARLTAKLTHPNVVQTLELGESPPGSPFFVMELVEGISLVRLVRKLAADGETLPPHLAAWIVGQAARGLHAAHELTDEEGRPLRVVHRDVSPHNILLSFEGRVCVADFGVAKLESADRPETSDGFVKGKVAYMAPEQARGQPLDRRADVFALGIILHELLTGRRLFEGSSPGEIVFKLLEVVPSDPSRERANIPADIAAVALRCLAKDPSERYATAAEVADAIRAALRARELAPDAQDLAAFLTTHTKTERADFDAKIKSCRSERAGARPVTASPSATPPSAPEIEEQAKPRTKVGLLAAALIMAIGGILATLAVIARTPASQVPRPKEEPAAVATSSATPATAIVSAVSVPSSPPTPSTLSTPTSPPPPSTTPRQPARPARAAVDAGTKSGVPFDSFDP